MTSFVPPKLLPQFADAEAVVQHALTIPGLRVAALIPNLRGAERGIALGVHKLNYVLSVSESHNQSNVRRSTQESVDDFRRIVAAVRAAAANPPVLCAGLATSFGCTFEGAVDPERVRRIAVELAEAGADEIALADTVGYGDPAAVKRLFAAVMRDVAPLPVGAHFHDTRGVGVANVMAALEVGVGRAFDASLAGLGGCPFAPGATGNQHASKTSVPLGEDFSGNPRERAAHLRRLSRAYWRDLEAREAYPVEFVRALTKAGFLGALIPEEYGGAGLPLRAAAAILEEIHASGCNAGPCHAQMYIMGTLLRHGSREQKERYLPSIASGELRLQAFGVTEPTSGTTKLKTRAVRRGDHYVVHGQKVWTSRALHSDLMLLLARTTPLEEVKKKTEGLSVFLVDIRRMPGQGPGDQAAQGDDQPPCHRSLLRRREGAGGQSHRRGRQGLQVHPRRPQCRAHSGLVRSDRRCALVHQDGCCVRQGADRVDRPIGQNQGIAFPIARAHAETEAAAMLLRKAAALFCRRPALRRRHQHGEAAHRGRLARR